MSTPPQTSRTSSTGSAPAGAACLIGAFLIWGLVPIYWKQLLAVPPFERILHRVTWSFLLLLPTMTVLRLWPHFRMLLGDRHTLGKMLVTTALLFVNWFVFVWAVIFFLNGSSKTGL